MADTTTTWWRYAKYQTGRLAGENIYEGCIALHNLHLFTKYVSLSLWNIKMQMHVICCLQRKVFAQLVAKMIEPIVRIAPGSMKVN